MNIIVAPDSFGGWLPASTIAERIAVQLEAAGFDAVQSPMSDGGEGLLDALQHGGWLDRIEAITALGPRNTERRGFIGWRSTRPVIESSVWLRDSEPLRPLETHSRGLGVVLHPHRWSTALVGLGGSSTVDAGLGLICGLGGTLLDTHGRPVEPAPSQMHRLTHIECPPDLARQWQVWCDVQTPLAQGAHRFGPQKGVPPDRIDWLASGWRHVADIFDRWRVAHGLAPIARDLPGGGAAGGLGFALANLGATLQHGAASCARAIGIDRAISTADLLITGEGRLDETTDEDKVVAHLADLCVQAGQPFAAVVGAVRDGAPALPGPVHVCGDSADRSRALTTAIEALVHTLNSSPQTPDRPISSSRSRKNA